MISAQLAAPLVEKKAPSKSLAAAMFFGSLYFVASSVCPDLANFTGSFAWVDPAAAAVLGVSCVLYGRKS